MIGYKVTLAWLPLSSFFFYFPVTLTEIDILVCKIRQINVLEVHVASWGSRGFLGQPSNGWWKVQSWWHWTFGVSTSSCLSQGVWGRERQRSGQSPEVSHKLYREILQCPAVIYGTAQQSLQFLTCKLLPGFIVVRNISHYSRIQLFIVLKMLYLQTVFRTVFMWEGIFSLVKNIGIFIVLGPDVGDSDAACSFCV